MELSPEEKQQWLIAIESDKKRLKILKDVLEKL